jgi:lysophospholipase L1-like esterase
MEQNAFSQDIGYTYLALGDSYTIGEGVDEQERFPHLAATLLREQGIAIKPPRYIAQTGWSTIALQQAIKNAEPLETWGLVTLLIGVNDQYQHLDMAGYQKRFTELLEKAITLANNRKERIYVLSIPDYSVTPFVKTGKEIISKEIEKFNKINKEITLAYGVAYIDITSLTKEAASDASLLASDGLHYSGKEHKKWAEKLLPYIKAVLK